MPEFIVPDYYQQIIDQTTAHDAEYFAAHPDEQSVIRRAVKGEFWPYQTPRDALTHVDQYAPGVRSRQLVTDKQMVPYPHCAELCKQMVQSVKTVSREQLKHFRAYLRGENDGGNHGDA